MIWNKLSFLLRRPSIKFKTNWLVFYFVLAFWCNQGLAQRTVNLVGDPWPPYVTGALGEDADSGIAVKIAVEIFSRIEGTDVRFPLIPWKRALLEVESGESDGIGMLLKTAEREQYMEYTVPLLTSSNLVWSATFETGKPFEWSDINDFFGYRIGIIDGYSYGDTVDQRFADGSITTVVAPTVENLFAMLANDRIDMVFATESVGQELAKKYPTMKILPARQVVDSEIFYMALSKKSWAAKLVPEINHIIEALHAEGFIRRTIRGEQ